MLDAKVAPGARVLHKILVVDDSATERLYVAELLLRQGYKVITAESCHELLPRIKAEQPSLILMDVVMPGTSGYQMTRTLSRDPQTAHIPVVLCTSKSNETDRIWGLRQGARDYLVKPVQAEQLLATIAGLLK
ncbi:MAG: response regulator [Quisquiliibacterium sp.]